jgi:hypothetical protein
MRITIEMCTYIHRVSQEERSVLWEVIILAILSKKVYTYLYMCHILNSFQDRVISLYSSKIVDKKEIYTVSNTGIYCLNVEVCTVYLVKYIFENYTVNQCTLQLL